MVRLWSHRTWQLCRHTQRIDQSVCSLFGPQQGNCEVVFRPSRFSMYAHRQSRCRYPKGKQPRIHVSVHMKSFARYNAWRTLNIIDVYLSVVYKVIHGHVHMRIAGSFLIYPPWLWIQITICKPVMGHFLS